MNLKNKKAQAADTTQLVMTAGLLVVITVLTVTFMIGLQGNASADMQRAHVTTEQSIVTSNELLTVLSNYNDSGVTYAQLIELSAVNSTYKSYTQDLLKGWLDDRDFMYHFRAEYKSSVVFDFGDSISGGMDVYESAVELPTEDKGKVEVSLETW